MIVKTFRFDILVDGASVGAVRLNRDRDLPIAEVAQDAIEGAAELFNIPPTADVAARLQECAGVAPLACLFCGARNVNPPTE